MESTNTILLQRNQVASLLSIEECMSAVEHAFLLYGEGKVATPKVIGMHVDRGGFHIKAGILGAERSYFVAKMNANFPGNPKQNGFPSIQGVIIVCDANNGRLLALMDSIEITIIRTGAATGIAAKHLASSHVATVTICGCGNQGRISLKALMKVRNLKKVFAYDLEKKHAEKLKEEFEALTKIIVLNQDELSQALKQSQIVVTCTPSKQPFIHCDDISPGTFIAAVGADSEEKQELCSHLVASNKLVADIAEQSATIGEFHHAIHEGLMTASDLHAELGSIIAGKIPGRESDDEIIIFDSTGTALQDVAAASIVYERAVANGLGSPIDFSEKCNLGKYESHIRRLKSWFPFR
jgi:ornithine cyclodeaminase/alanine dehydrogenase